jgi:carbonic anhydrase
VAVSLFGGIPVTAVIVRSALNVQAGARTRRSAIIHSLVLLAAVYFLAPLMGRIPIAALAGVLLSVALRMLHPRELKALWKMSRMEAAVYLVTFAAIVLVDLIVGVQAGIVVALVIAAVRLGRVHTSLLHMETPGPYRFLLSGGLTFLSSAKLEKLRAQIRELEPSRGIVFDLSDVTSVDASGAELLVELVGALLDGGFQVAIQGPRPEVRKMLMRQAQGERMEPLFALTESDVMSHLEGSAKPSARDRLVRGVESFRQGRHQRYGPLFDRLAHGQKPHTLFITCSDSRICPSLVTSTDPGELFIVRNVGNLVPPTESPLSASVGSAIEYAVEVLGVTDVIVCGHSGCGAMRALLGMDRPEGLPGVQRWLHEGQDVVSRLPEGATPEEAAKLNALMQLRNALTYPVLRRKYDAGEVRLHAWFFDVGSSEFSEWDASTGSWNRLGTHVLPFSPFQPRSGSALDEHEPHPR